MLAPALRIEVKTSAGSVSVIHDARDQRRGLGRQDAEPPEQRAEDDHTEQRAEILDDGAEIGVHGRGDRVIRRVQAGGLGKPPRPARRPRAGRRARPRVTMASPAAWASGISRR